VSEPLQLTRDQKAADDGHLRLLAFLHFVAAFLCLAGIGLLVWHYTRMHNAFLDITAWKKQKGARTSLEPFFGEFRRYYLICGAVLAAVGAANMLSSLLIGRKKGRVMSIVVACLNCIIVPLGTVLGAFTLVVLLRDTVREAYKSAAARPEPLVPRRPG
jgi:hypothetical protein